MPNCLDLKHIAFFLSWFKYSSIWLYPCCI